MSDANLLVLLLVITNAAFLHEAAKLQHPRASNVRGGFNTLCTKFVGFAKILQAPHGLKSESEVQQQLKEMFLPMLGRNDDIKLWSQWIEDQAPQVLKMLRKDMTPEQICSRPSIFPTARSSAAKENHLASSGALRGLFRQPPSELDKHRLGKTLCDYCIEYDSLMKRMLGDTEAQADVVTYFKVLCNAFSFLKTPCGIWFDHYIPELMQHYADTINPVKDCMNEYWCQPSEDVKRRHPQHLPSLDAMAASGRSDQLGESLCDYCIKFGMLFKEFMSDPQSAGQISHSLLSTCDVLTKLKDPCYSWLLTHAPAVIEMFASEINPKLICTNATFCKPTDEAVHTSPAAKNDGLCSLCETALEEVRQILKDGKSRASILKYIKDNLCTILPEDKDKCDHAVDTYGPIIMQLLATELDPLTVCKMIGYCSPNDTLLSSGPKVHGISAVGPRQDTVCTMCEAAMNQARKMLLDDKTRAAISKFIKDRLCNILPDDKDECNHTVDTYGRIIMQLLATELNPTVVCGSFIGLCRKKMVEATAPKVEGGAASQFCTLCQLGVKYFQNVLETDNATRSKVLANVESWCIFVPPANRTDCHNFVKQYLIEIVVDIDPHRYCQGIFACAPDPTIEPPKVAQLLSGVLRFRAAVEKSQRLRGRKRQDVPLL